MYICYIYVYMLYIYIQLCIYATPSHQDQYLFNIFIAVGKLVLQSIDPGPGTSKYSG